MTQDIVPSAPMQTGAIQPAHGGTIIPIRDSDRARQLGAKGNATKARRREIAIIRALKGMRNAVLPELPDGSHAGTWADAWEKIVCAQSKLANTGGKGSTQAATFVGRATSLLVDERGRDDGDVALSLKMSTAAVQAIGEMLARRAGEQR